LTTNHKVFRHSTAGSRSINTCGQFYDADLEEFMQKLGLV